MPAFTDLGPDSSIGDILFSRPDRFGPFLSFANDVMRGAGSLEPGVRELLAAYVSGLNECSFCHGVHEATAQRFDVDSELLVALLSDVESSMIDENLQPIFEFARALTLAPAKVSDRNRLAVLEAGYSEATLGDIITIVALFNFFNRLVDGHGVKGNGEIFERDSGMLQQFGYAPPPQ